MPLVLSRTLAYWVSLGLVLGATALTASSILLPTWITLTSNFTKNHRAIGLHRYCHGTYCTPFPRPQACSSLSNPHDNFASHIFNICTLWKSASFLISLALATEVVTLICFLLILAPITGALSGQTKRREGWRVLVVLMGLIVCFEVAAVAMVGYVFENDEMYSSRNWRLGAGWGCAMGSWIVVLIAAIGLGAGVYVVGRREKVGGEVDDVSDPLLRDQREGGGEGRTVGYGASEAEV